MVKSMCTHVYTHIKKPVSNFNKKLINQSNDYVLNYTQATSIYR